MVFELNGDDDVVLLSRPADHLRRDMATWCIRDYAISHRLSPPDCDEVARVVLIRVAKGRGLEARPPWGRAASSIVSLIERVCMRYK